MQASSALDPIARSLLAALCRSAFVRLPGSALAPALDDLPLPPRAWASSSLQCFHYHAGSGGCEGHEDRPLLTLIYAPGQPGLQVGCRLGAFVDSTCAMVPAGNCLAYAQGKQPVACWRPAGHRSARLKQLQVMPCWTQLTVQLLITLLAPPASSAI